jgi:hypothetical protein
LESNDYIQIRNVLRVLTVLLPIYPKIKTFYAALERRIRTVCQAEKDSRHDLFALAKCYSGRLAHKSQNMLDESQFHMVPERTAPSLTQSSSRPTNPVTGRETKRNIHRYRYDCVLSILFDQNLHRSYLQMVKQRSKIRRRVRPPVNILSPIRIAYEVQMI